jgi:hypothetical protein
MPSMMGREEKNRKTMYASEQMPKNASSSIKEFHVEKSREECSVEESGVCVSKKKSCLKVFLKSEVKWKKVRNAQNGVRSSFKSQSGDQKKVPRANKQRKHQR